MQREDSVRAIRINSSQGGSRHRYLSHGRAGGRHGEAGDDGRIAGRPDLPLLFFLHHRQGFFRAHRDRTIRQRAEVFGVAGLAPPVVSFGGQPVRRPALLGALAVQMLAMILHQLPFSPRPAGDMPFRDGGGRRRGGGSRAPGQRLAVDFLRRARALVLAGLHVEHVHHGCHSNLLLGGVVRDRRKFFRNWGPGAGNNAGAWGRDEIRNIHGSAGDYIWGAENFTGALSTSKNQGVVVTTGGGSSYPRKNMEFDASKSVPTGPENVPPHVWQPAILYLGRPTQV
uniref:Uncharacterized protein n=1 Tax=Myoviridae sp. ctWPU11 TaxID=2825118 RepID=A0A8S5UAL2_9CAUD|nr:MAG TPA: hypothetical protein [Myoviridae sp. ctWPU11]